MIRRIHPASRSFNLVLGLLAALPTAGIDIILPSLPATGMALGAPMTRMGLAMSAYLVSLGAALLVYGPMSDHFGRKPAVVWGCIILILASGGCIVARSLDELLVCRVLQGAGAAGPGMAAIAMVRDLFDGETARAKMSHVVFAVNIMPMIAPSIGALLLALGGWRAVYAVPIAGALVLLATTSFVDETARIDRAARLYPRKVGQDYLRALTHPICLGNTLCNAAAAGAVFAYITGSSLFLINALGLSPQQYGLIFGASSLSVMAGTVVNQRLSAWSVPPGQLIAAGLIVSTMFATLLLVETVVGSTSIMLIMAVMVGVALSFGLISPNATSGALHPLPDIAGSASAVVMFIQLAAAATSSALVGHFFDGHSAFSMAAVMLPFCLLSAASYLCLTRLARHIAAAA